MIRWNGWMRALVGMAACTLALSCSSSDDGNASTNGDPTNGDPTNGDPTNGDPNEGIPTDGTSSAYVSFDVSGDVTAEMEGSAYVGGSGTPTGGAYGLNFNGDTFSLLLSRQGEGTDSPDVGTYTLGSIVDSDFMVLLDIFEDGDRSNSENYAILSGTAGTLEITASSASSVSGTFEFTAGALEHSGEVTVSNGQFRAE